MKLLKVIPNTSHFEFIADTVFVLKGEITDRQFSICDDQMTEQVFLQNGIITSQKKVIH